MTVFFWVNYKTYALFFTYFCSIGSWVKDRFPVIQLIIWEKYSCFIIQPLLSYSIASKLDDGVTLMGGVQGSYLRFAIPLHRSYLHPASILAVSTWCGGR